MPRPPRQSGPQRQEPSIAGTSNAQQRSQTRGRAGDPSLTSGACTVPARGAGHREKEVATQLNLRQVNYTATDLIFQKPPDWGDST